MPPPSVPWPQPVAGDSRAGDAPADAPPINRSPRPAVAQSALPAARGFPPRDEELGLLPGDADSQHHGGRRGVDAKDAWLVGQPREPRHGASGTVLATLRVLRDDPAKQGHRRGGGAGRRGGGGGAPALLAEPGPSSAPPTSPWQAGRSTTGSPGAPTRWSWRPGSRVWLCPERGRTFTTRCPSPIPGAARRGMPMNMVACRLIRRSFGTSSKARSRSTEAARDLNPAAATPPKGWWRSATGGSLGVDHLTSIFGLVRMLQFDGAMDHFTSWKTGLERGLNQEVILITYYPVSCTTRCRR